VTLRPEAAVRRGVVVLLLTIAGSLAAFTGVADAQGPIPAAPVTIDGPSAGILSLGGVSVARDGTGGLVYLTSVAGVAHVFVSRLVGGSFQAPAEVDGSLPGPSSQPVIAAGNGGVLLIAFINGGVLYVVRRPSSVRPYLASVAIDGNASNPSIQMTTFGKAYLTFTTADGDGYDVRAAYYYDGRWSLEASALNAVPGDDAGTGSGRPAVATAGDGVAIVVWGENDHIYSRRVWGTAPSIVYEQADVPSLDGWTELSADEPSVASGGDSSYADVAFRAVLTNGSQTQERVLMNRLQGSVYDGIQQPDGLSTPGPEGADQPQVAETEYGHGLIISARDTSDQLMATTLGDNGVTTGTVRVDSLQNASAPDGVAGTDGLFSGMIAWQQDPGAFGIPEIRARDWDTFTGFGSELALSSPLLGPVDAADGLATEGDILGDAAVVWVQGAPGARVIEAAQLYQPPGGFGASESFRYARTVHPVLAWSGTSELWGVRYLVSVDGAQIGQTTATSFTVGTALAQGPHSWQVTAVNGAGLTSSTRAATVFVDTIRPTAHFALAGAKRPGSPLHIYVTYTDAPPGVAPADASGVASVVVNWGDHSIHHIRHRDLHSYARPGLYLLRVTVTDRAGNATKLTGWIRIGAKQTPGKKTGRM
jgi:hypothetical protein